MSLKLVGGSMVGGLLPPVLDHRELSPQLLEHEL